MKKFFVSLLLWFLSILPIVNAVVIEIPDPEWNSDIWATIVNSTQISWDESSFFNTIQMVNKYLWMSIGLVCMIFLVSAGIWLITANGDEKKMKNANKTLWWAIIWILISIMSYAIIRLVINLF